jgi:hypothetical protein
MIIGPDSGLTGAPTANFQKEMERLDLRASKFRAMPVTNEDFTRYQTQTANADLDDLREALKQAATPAEKLDEIVADHLEQRQQLGKYLDALEEWESSGDFEVSNGVYTRRHDTPHPSLYAFGLKVTDGLPGEFADYFRGGIEWHAEHTNEARAAWETLLRRPADERHYRSTWAAYMLGRSWEDEDTNKAIGYFRETQRLASAGFADHLGLAIASEGREARLDLQRGEIEKAIELYLDTMAAGDETVFGSLRFAAAKALNRGTNELPALAENPRTRRVITAYLISRREYDGYDYAELRSAEPANEPGTFASLATRWLNAVEAANVTDVESAEELALAAYQRGECETAQRWVDRAPATPTARWLQAKLLLRAGKDQEAAALLAEVVKLFPAEPPERGPGQKPGLENNLTMAGFTYLTNETTAHSEVLGELGAMELERRDYAEALDALARAGFWEDAAYLGERVLSADELKSYVDIHWAAKSEETQTNTNTENFGWPLIDVRTEMRHMLARRLSRLGRSDEARDYYPTNLQADYEAFVANLKRGEDTGAPAEVRGRALFQAAVMAKTNGMELFGTEVEPDWRIRGGDFEDEVFSDSRATNTQSGVYHASEDEIARAKGNDVIPEVRFHYRYYAAALGWRAAELMPDNSDETARMLCIAGTWLKNIDATDADQFYKSLVRRCRKTAIGALADKMRWFPILDHAGNIVPWEPAPPIEDTTPVTGPSADGSGTVITGYRYTAARGDALRDIAEAANAAHGLGVTVRDLIKANPEVSPYALYTGNIIFVPAIPRQEGAAK